MNLYHILDIVPIEVNLSREALSLFYNSWMNKENPVTKLNIEVLKQKLKGEIWINYIAKLLKKFNLPTPLEILESELVTKDSWKNLTKAIIEKHHTQLINEKIDQKRSCKYYVKQDYGFGKGMAKIASVANTPKEVFSAELNIKLLISEADTNTNKYRLCILSFPWTKR